MPPHPSTFFERIDAVNIRSHLCLNGAYFDELNAQIDRRHQQLAFITHSSQNSSGVLACAAYLEIHFDSGE